MHRHIYGFVIGCALGLFTVPVNAAKSDPPPKVHDFDIETTCRLGREIYQHDQLAWVATDVLFAGVPKDKLAQEKVAGWVVDTSGPAALVRFLRPQGDTFESAYDVVFAKGAKPKLQTPEHRELSTAQLARARAVATTRPLLRDRKLPWCGGNANIVVLPHPENDGLLVYILRPKEKANEIPVGGHYRITMTADGRVVKQVEQLFASCLTLSKTPPDGAKSDTALLIMSHVVSDRPLETHVFLSLQDAIPFMVVTDEKTGWHVNGGRFTRVDLSELDSADAKK